MEHGRNSGGKQRRSHKAGKRTTRAERLARQYPPQFYDDIPASRGAWYESETERAAALRWSRRKAKLLRWVRREMDRRLTPRERCCIELHYFAGLSYRSIGVVTKTNHSSVCRAVARGLDRLRAAAREDEALQAVLRRRGGETEE